MPKVNKAVIENTESKRNKTRYLGDSLVVKIMSYCGGTVSLKIKCINCNNAMGRS